MLRRKKNLSQSYKIPRFNTQHERYSSVDVYFLVAALLEERGVFLCYSGDKAGFLRFLCKVLVLFCPTFIKRQRDCCLTLEKLMSVAFWNCKKLFYSNNCKNHKKYSLGLKHQVDILTLIYLRDPGHCRSLKTVHGNYYYIFNVLIQS